MAKNNICILGAGLAGLSAGWHLAQKGIRSEIFEKENNPGGLCRSKSVSGFTFDYDGHLFHCKYKYTHDLVCGKLGITLVNHKRSAWVYSRGVYCRYPFQANLFGLPAAIISECLLGFIKAQQDKRCVQSKPADFLEWINRTFGRGIAKHFMIPYNTKFWTVPPSRLNCEWLDNFIPVPSLGDVVEGSVADDSRNTRQFGYNAHFWYPRKGGIGQIADAMAAKLPGIHTGCQVDEINIKKRYIRFNTGKTQGYENLVLTIPLPELPGLIPDMPGRVCALFSKLKWNSILNLNIGIDAKTVKDKHWIYFSQRNIPFFRVGFAHNFSSSLAPGGKGSLYVEIAYSRNKPINKKAALRMSVEKLRALGLISKRETIICRDLNDIVYGYPIYDHDHHKASQGIIEYLRKNKIFAAGRYGSWKYLSMENAILDGKRASEILMRAL
jgi:protoporphyrinogen oxidase